MKLAAYGQREWLCGGFIALAMIAVGFVIAHRHHTNTGYGMTAVAVVGWLALAFFFRVPDRRIPPEAGVLVSPADGVVKDINTVIEHGIEPFAGQPLVCIGIFLSVFDVHVNRAPCKMEVTYRKYKPGRFHDARNPLAAKENESLTIGGYGHIGAERFPLAIRQISGAIARRIVCEPQVGDLLQKGGIYGMIKFGSRTELYLPDDGRINPSVSIGRKVRSGSTVIAIHEKHT